MNIKEIELGLTGSESGPVAGFCDLDAWKTTNH
jgi:hypothetical protein